MSGKGKGSSQDLCEGLHYVLKFSIWLYDREGHCPLGRSGEGQVPSQTLMKVICPFKNLHKGLHPVLHHLSWVYNGKGPVFQEGLGKDRDLSRTFEKVP